MSGSAGRAALETKPPDTDVYAYHPGSRSPCFPLGSCLSPSPQAFGRSSGFAYRPPLLRGGIVPLDGGVDDAYDNAIAESFFASLECEVLDRIAKGTHRRL